MSCPPWCQGDCGSCGSSPQLVSALAAAGAYVLIREPGRCVECGNCEANLPGLEQAMINHRLLISATHLAANRPAIDRALKSCHLDALTLEVVG